MKDTPRRGTLCPPPSSPVPRHNHNNPIWGSSVLTSEEPPPHSRQSNHALSLEGGPTQSQLTRPVSSGHHISIEHRLRREHPQWNSDTNACNETLLKEMQKKGGNKKNFLKILKAKTKMKKRRNTFCKEEMNPKFFQKNKMFFLFFCLSFFSLFLFFVFLFFLLFRFSFSFSLLFSSFFLSFSFFLWRRVEARATHLPQRVPATGDPRFHSKKLKTETAQVNISKTWKLYEKVEICYCFWKLPVWVMVCWCAMCGCWCSVCNVWVLVLPVQCVCWC